MSRTRALRWAAGAATAAAVAGGCLLGFHVENLHNGLIATAFAGVGLFVLRRAPGNREGRLFVATGVAHAVMFAGRQYALHDRPLPGAAWAGWLGVWPLPLVLVLVGVTVMAFPSGRLPSPRWRPVVGLLAAAGLVLAVVSALWPVEYARTGLLAPHPLHLPGFAAADAFYRVARPVGYLTFQLLPAACVLARMARARGDEARQLRWFAYAVALAAAVMLLGLATTGSPVPGTLAIPLVAAAAGAAILRYRLYDIDPVINRSLVFAAMAAAVTLGYALVVTGAGRLAGGHGTAASIVATGLVAVAFEPLRRRVQRLADRLVYGRRATPYEALARLSAHLAGPGGGLLAGICATVADAVGARAVVLWTGEPDRAAAPSADPGPSLSASAGAGPSRCAGAEPSGRADARPGGGRSALADTERLRATAGWPAGVELPGGRRLLGELDAVPVRHDGRLLGAIAVRMPPGETLGAGARRLVGDLAAQAGLVLQLRASAQRLVAAGDAARRRLERDLHDGAQQRLVTVALELGAVVRLADERGAPDVAERAEDVRAQLLQATAELRETARGLHPAVLTQDGLEAALGFLADRAAVPVRLTVAVPRRLPAEVEATAYFMVSEGLTNVARHARATLAAVRAELTPAGLAVEVADDGRGGATARPGRGLEGLADRLAILDARLAVDTGPAGTRLAAVIPCG